MYFLPVLDADACATLATLCRPCKSCLKTFAGPFSEEELEKGAVISTSSAHNFYLLYPYFIYGVGIGTKIKQPMALQVL